VRGPTECLRTRLNLSSTRRGGGETQAPRDAVPGRAASLRCAGWLRSVSTLTADRSPGASAAVPRLRGAKLLVGGGSPRSGTGRGVHQPARRVSGRGRWHVRPEPARDGQVPVETTLQRADASGHGVCSRRPAWLGRVPRPRVTSAAGPSRLCSTGPSRHTCRRSSGARREKTGPVDGRRSSDASSRPISGVGSSTTDSCVCGVTAAGTRPSSRSVAKGGGSARPAAVDG
jgi:hypothetical protein